MAFSQSEIKGVARNLPSQFGQRAEMISLPGSAGRAPSAATATDRSDGLFFLGAVPRPRASDLSAAAEIRVGLRDLDEHVARLGEVEASVIGGHRHKAVAARRQVAVGGAFPANQNGWGAAMFPYLSRAREITRILHKDT
jgi:hypothetical protein